MMAAASLRPMRLREGDTVALFAPATVTYEALELELAVETLEAMGLRVKVGRHVLDRYGYFAGGDKQRAGDINRAFADPEVKGLFALRGGWGSSRLLPLLDYDAIARNPKIVLGYSDITSLLNGILARTGLVTFHGPNAWSEWNSYSYQSMRNLLFDGEALVYRNEPQKNGDLVAKKNRIQTITPGIARGDLIGGNLTLVAALLGTPYLPSFEGRILFLEDVSEAIYRMDRMLTQLALAGKLQQLAGIVFGQFVGVEPQAGFGNFSLMDIFRQHCEPLGIPCYYGASFGHVAKNSTLPLGVRAEMDAAAGTLALLESAVRSA
jgi:muramoyltetrapeptide carboxypeptidase